MLQTIIRILPLAIGATINPTGFLVVLMILSNKDRPSRKGLAFILGSTLTLVIIGTIIFATFRPAIQGAAPSYEKTISAVIDIVLGSLIIIVLAKEALSKKPKEQAEEKTKHKRPYFILGLGYMLIDFSSLIPYVGALKIIAEANLKTYGLLFVFLITLLITMSMLAIPVFLYLITPSRAAIIMAPIERFMNKHGKTIAVTVFAIMAIYLIAKGTIHLIIK